MDPVSRLVGDTCRDLSRGGHPVARKSGCPSNRALTSTWDLGSRKGHHKVMWVMEVTSCFSECPRTSLKRVLAIFQTCSWGMPLPVSPFLFYDLLFKKGSHPVAL